MAHCAVEETAVLAAEADLFDAEDELEIAQTVYDTATTDLTVCEAEH